MAQTTPGLRNGADYRSDDAYVREDVIVTDGVYFPGDVIVAGSNVVRRLVVAL